MECLGPCSVREFAVVTYRFVPERRTIALKLGVFGFPILPVLLTNEWLDWKKQQDIISRIKRKGHFASSGIAGMVLHLSEIQRVVIMFCVFFPFLLLLLDFSETLLVSLRMVYVFCGKCGSYLGFHLEVIW